jgi:hypothetical protein
VAFADTDGTGVSVVRERCIEELGEEICAHIAKHYKPSISGNPPVFWRFYPSVLPDGATFDPDTYRNDDPCHTNIINISPKQARNIMKDAPISNMEICSDTGIRTLTIDDIDQQLSETI